MMMNKQTEKTLLELIKLIKYTSNRVKPETDTMKDLEIELAYNQKNRQTNDSL